MAKKKNEEPLRKAKYGTIQCFRWILSRMWKWDKSLFLSSVTLLPVTVVLYALGLYMPSVILDSLLTSSGYEAVVMVILILVGAEFFSRVIQALLSQLRANAESRNANRFYWEITKAEALKDHFLDFDEEWRKISERAWSILGNGADGSPGRYVIQFFDMLANAACFLMFGAVISALSPLILVFLILGCLITLIPRRCQQDREYIERDERNANSGKLDYLSRRLSNILRAGKDIRLFHFLPMLEKKTRVVIDEHTMLLRRRQRYRSWSAYINMGVGFVRDGLAYLFLIRGVLQGSVTPTEFVLYFNAIARVSDFIDQVIRYLGSAHEVVLGISDCIVFLDESRNRMNHGEGIAVPKGRPVSVEFRHVTYRYPRGEKDVLEDVSFCVAAGEKISLVGLNGAGKTTLTKLACGLLLPDSGEVLIDGHSVLEYNRDELYSLFSLVPQDYVILPTTVAENIAFCDRSEIDEERLWSCLEMAQIADKIRSLPKRIDSEMDRRFVDDAVNLSGGEMQRLLLARALYHESSVMILDEPTAALDPIAEDAVYQHYRQMTEGVTTFFISHRLASTRFCDRIYLLEGAHLTEVGTHEELMALGGRYRELFEIQSRYYREGGEAE